MFYSKKLIKEKNIKHTVFLIEKEENQKVFIKV